MHKPRRHAMDLVVNGLQTGQELLDSETAESAAALELGDMQGHFGAWMWVNKRDWEAVSRCARQGRP